jgi:predicted acyl esterase
MKSKIFIFFMLGFTSLAYSQLKPVVDSIPMSDGRKLAADIYIPKGMSSGPVILIQTPYNRQLMRLTGLPMGFGYQVDSSPYIFVITDWRGFYGSRNSAYVGNPDRGTDGFSTVEWLAGQSWSNGKIGTWGPSALGKIQFQTAAKKPPHLTCICPSVAAPQFAYKEYFPNGVLKTEYVEQLDQLGFGLTSTLMNHPYYDNTWLFAERTNFYPDSISVPAFMVGGWYDHNIDLMLQFFSAMQNGKQAVKDQHKLLMGPWVHGGHGTARVGTANQGELVYANAENKNDSLSREFFNYYLRGIQNKWNEKAPVTYYNMGENIWKTSNRWPVNDFASQTLYFHKDGTLSSNPPIGISDSLNFDYNPLDPSPTIGGCTLRNDLEQGPYDQKAEVESRNDVLVFSTNVLTKPIHIKGVAVVRLVVSSDQLDTDFDIRMTDVYPDGRSMLINDAAYRMRFREGWYEDQSVMMKQGKKYVILIELPNTSISILPGHQLRIIVSSSNYPKYNRNMNNGNDMYPFNSLDTIINPNTVRNTVYMNSKIQSQLFLQVSYNTDIESVVHKNNTFEVYPNPVVSVLNLQRKEGLNPNAEYQIFNGSGQMMLSGRVEEGPIDVSSLRSGLYVVVVRNEGQAQALKFIKTD